MSNTTCITFNNNSHDEFNYFFKTFEDLLLYGNKEFSIFDTIIVKLGEKPFELHRDKPEEFEKMMTYCSDNKFEIMYIDFNILKPHEPVTTFKTKLLNYLKYAVEIKTQLLKEKKQHSIFSDKNSKIDSTFVRIIDKNLITANMDIICQEIIDKPVYFALTKERMDKVEILKNHMLNYENSAYYHLCGLPGEGKTYTLFYLACDLRNMNFPVIYFDFSVKKSKWIECFYKELFYSLLCSDSKNPVLDELKRTTLDINFKDFKEGQIGFFKNFSDYNTPIIYTAITDIIKIFHTIAPDFKFYFIFDQVNKILSPNESLLFENCLNEILSKGHRSVICSSNNNKISRDCLLHQDPEK